MNYLNVLKTKILIFSWPSEIGQKLAIQTVIFSYRDRQLIGMGYLNSQLPINANCLLKTVKKHMMSLDKTIPVPVMLTFALNVSSTI